MKNLIFEIKKIRALRSRRESNYKPISMGNTRGPSVSLNRISVSHKISFMCISQVKESSDR